MLTQPINGTKVYGHHYAGAWANTVLYQLVTTSKYIYISTIQYDMKDSKWKF